MRVFSLNSELQRFQLMSRNEHSERLEACVTGTVHVATLRDAAPRVALEGGVFCLPRIDPSLVTMSLLTGGLAAAREAWRDWLKSERRLPDHTLVAYEHAARCRFLGFMTELSRQPHRPRRHWAS